MARYSEKFKGRAVALLSTKSNDCLLTLKKPRPMGQVSMVFLGGYGVFRFIAEFARQPDDYLGLLNGISMGQWLSLPMILLGIIGFIYFGQRAKKRAA